MSNIKKNLLKMCFILSEMECVIHTNYIDHKNNRYLKVKICRLEIYIYLNLCKVHYIVCEHLKKKKVKLANKNILLK